MGNKTVITIDYEAGPNGIAEVSSAGIYIEDENVQAMKINNRLDLIMVTKIIDKFLRKNGISELRFKEVAE